VENAQVAAYLAHVARTLDARGAPLDGHVGHAVPPQGPGQQVDQLGRSFIALIKRSAKQG
jgi:hypothetical protein